MNIKIMHCKSDLSTNNNGKNLLEICKNIDIGIVNGRIGESDDKSSGLFTCYNYNGRSVIVYAIASHALFSYFLNFRVDVLDASMSDVHCSISFTLKSITDIAVKFVEDNSDSKNKSTIDHAAKHTVYSFNWNNTLAATFKASLDNIDTADFKKQLHENCLQAFPSKC